MVRTFRYSLYTLLLIGLSIPTVNAADDNNHAAGKGPQAANAADASVPAADLMTEKEMKVVVEGFGTNEAFVKSRWDAKLPAALEAARKDKKEEDVATIFSKLVAMVNGEQMKKMGELANKAASEEESGANRYGELLKHMIWTKEIFFPSEKTDALKFKPEGAEFETFKKLLVEKWNEQKKKNDDFYTLLDKASKDGPGKEAAVEELRKKYDPKALIAFIDSQAKSGNKELADKLGSALSFSENARNFVDAVNKDGDKVRINFTKEKGLSAALAEYSTKTGKPVANLSFSPTKHDVPGIEFTPGQEIVKNAAATKVDTTGAATPKAPAQGTEEKKDSVENKKKDESAKVNKSSALGVAALGNMVTACASCHATGKKNVAAFNFTEFTNNPTPELLARVLDRAVTTGDMPPSGKGSEALKKSIQDWATESGVK